MSKAFCSTEESLLHEKMRKYLTKMGIHLYRASPQRPSHKEVPAGGHLDAPPTQFAGGNYFYWADFCTRKHCPGSSIVFILDQV